MDQRFDVIVVGAVDAGPAVATLAAKAGLRVCLLDTGATSSLSPPVALVQADNIEPLHRLDLLDRLVVSGAPRLDLIASTIDDAVLDGPLPKGPDDPFGALCVHREVIEAALLDSAERAGVVVRAKGVLKDLVRDGERVCGVVMAGGRGDERFVAPVVVGSDGRSSQFATLVGATPRYHAPTGREYLWASFAGATLESPPRLHLHRRAGDGVLACPADSGVLLIALAVDRDHAKPFHEAIHFAFTETVNRWPQVAKLLGGALLLGDIGHVPTADAFERPLRGKGWVLVGETAGVPDRLPALSVADALRQGTRLADALATGLGGGNLDEELTSWALWCSSEISGTRQHDTSTITSHA